MAGSAASVSAVTVAGHLPWLLFSLFGGVIVDHFDRARLLWLAGLAQAVLVGAFAVWLFLGTPDLISLVLLALLMGMRRDRPPDRVQRAAAGRGRVRGP